MGDVPRPDAVNFEWLHLSDTEDSPYETSNYEIESKDIYPSDELKMPENVAPRYYDALKIEPKIQGLLDNFETIRSEILSLIRSNEWTPWPELELYSGKQQKGQWKVIPLLYTFPADNIGSMTWVESNTKLCPVTTQVLKSIPNIRTALFSRMGGQTRLAAHQGWADLANHVLRCHLPIIVPERKRNYCGMWVEGWVNYHKERKLIMFDDSKWHKAFNASTGDRIVLIFDILRPKELPRGSATGGHTEKLDEFIAAFEQLGKVNTT